MVKKKIIITIDGPSGSGKSTIARLLAKKLNYLYLDTGAMYRAVAWKVLNSGINPESRKEVVKVAEESHICFREEGDSIHIFLDGDDVSNEIREERVAEVASIISVIPEVRRRLVKLQRDMAKDGGIILEGRDTGTIVCPFADIKFYLDASPQQRGKRRYLEIREKSVVCDIEDIIEDMKFRDQRDSKRRHSPLKMAEDAIFIDSTNLKIEEVLLIMLKKVNKLLVSR